LPKVSIGPSGRVINPKAKNKYNAVTPHSRKFCVHRPPPRE
jgi:hypothetical protein